MTFKQLLPITTDLKSPFTLTVVPIAFRPKCKRTKFKCGYRALQSLKDLKLNPAKYYGADVCDAEGRTVAELE